ncbi:D-aminoacylase [Nocardioides mangrovicus]|uniref:D-aminoacylase n=1 Tax=Nocardioides mangrovicus TaxID=2478913 RepID=A0A3L8P515_9ACTN|nr:D-aminoacylase [Nocardioides mangrovicus]RLV49853.1 D-aminoacylase [Nocardioides mangrovicus]
MRTLVRDALVVDGSGEPGYTADVGIVEGRITFEPVRDAHVVESRGRVLCPGFIDMHAHSDVVLLTEPEHTAKVSQGVTLEVLGQDGLSFAPTDEPTRVVLRQQIAGWNGDCAEAGWDTVADYLARLDEGIACHAAYLVPQGTLRLMVVGADDRPATSAEIDAMCDLLAQGLSEGAFGMSSGLTYAPGMYADDAELAALLRVVAEHGGYYSPHHRSYGAGALEAYAEMIELCERTGCPLHLTHATLNFEPNRGRAPELVAMLDAALERGLDLTLDSYPYLAGATTLAALLPGWASSGGPTAVLERLADPEQAQRIRHDVEVSGSDGCHGCVVDWSTVQVSGTSVPERAGTYVRDFEDAVGLLQADRLATSVLQHVGHEDNVRTIMRHRTHCGGSDAILVGERPHPRAWGTFPRYLGHYVAQGVLDLVEAVHHLTGRPASRLGLTDRGLVREGHAADLVLLDPDRVRDTATYADPRRQCEGIDEVWVAGESVVSDGRRTAAMPGRALRRRGSGRRGSSR